MKVSIRKATSDDASTIADILTEATHYKLQHRDTAWGPHAYIAEEVNSFLDDAYLVYLEDKLAGTVTLQWEDWIWGHQPPNAGYMHKLAVKPNFRGLNIGEQVVAWALSEVKARNRECLRLDCLTSNEKLCRYYEKLGFQRVGVHEFPDHTTGLYERHVDFYMEHEPPIN